MSKNDLINDFKSLPDNLNNYLLIQKNDLDNEIIIDAPKKISRFKFDFKNKNFWTKLSISKSNYQDNRQQQSNVRFNEFTSFVVDNKNKLHVLPFGKNHLSSDSLIEKISSKNLNNLNKMIKLGFQKDPNQTLNIEMLPTEESFSLKHTDKDGIVHLNSKFKIEPEVDSGLYSAYEEPSDIILKLNKPKTKLDPFEITEDSTTENNDVLLFNNENCINVTNINETRNSFKFLPKYRPFSSINRRLMNNKIKFKQPQQQQEDLKEINDNKDDSKICNYQNLKLEMPVLNEVNEQINTTILSQNDFDNSHFQQINLLQDTSSSILQFNQSNNNNTLGLNQLDIHTSKQNLLTSLEYLMNNSKGNVFNTTVAIANIAAAASGLENKSNNNETNETALQTLLIDLVMPTATSQFDLSSTKSDPVELSLFYQQQLDNQVTTTQTNTLFAGLKHDLNNSNFNFTSINNSTHLNPSNKQTNDQIMRTCMGYLDYINKKHNKERRLQIIKNKISGFILLTIVFLMVFALAMIMTFFLTNAITQIIKMSREKSQEKTENTSIYSIGIHTNQKFPILPSQNLANIIINKKKTSDGGVSLNLPFLNFNRTSEIDKSQLDFDQSNVKRNLAELLIQSSVRDEVKLFLKNLLNNLFNVSDVDGFFLEQKTNQIQNGIVDFLVSALKIYQKKTGVNVSDENIGGSQNYEIANSKLVIENTDAYKYYIGYVPELNSLELS